MLVVTTRYEIQKAPTVGSVCGGCAFRNTNGCPDTLCAGRIFVRLPENPKETIEEVIEI